MRKGLAEGQNAIHLDRKALQNLESNGYKYVQIKGLSVDKHYDYIDSHFIVLVPMKELPSDQAKKDVYEPIESEILLQWASEKNEHLEFVIAQAV